MVPATILRRGTWDLVLACELPLLLTGGGAEVQSWTAGKDLSRDDPPNFNIGSASPILPVKECDARVNILTRMEYNAADHEAAFGFLVPYFDLEVILFPTPPCV